MKTIEEVKRVTKIPVVIADEQGYIGHVNHAFEAVFGWTRDEIVGKPLTTIIPKNLHDAHHLGFSSFLTTGKPKLLAQPLQLKAVTKDGEEFDAEHFIVAERREDHWVFAATIKPIENH